MCKARQSSWYSTFCVWRWQNIVLGPVSGGRRCLCLFPQSAKWLLRPCNPFGINVRLLEKSHSVLMPKHASWHWIISFVSSGSTSHFFFFFCCSFCWADYPIDKAGFSVECGIASKIGLLIWHTGWVFPYQIAEGNPLLVGCAVHFSSVWRRGDQRSQGTWMF